MCAPSRRDGEASVEAVTSSRRGIILQRHRTNGRQHEQHPGRTDRGGNESSIHGLGSELPPWKPPTMAGSAIYALAWAPPRIRSTPRSCNGLRAPRRRVPPAPTSRGAALAVRVVARQRGESRHRAPLRFRPRSARGAIHGVKRRFRPTRSWCTRRVKEIFDKGSSRSWSPNQDYDESAKEPW